MREASAFGFIMFIVLCYVNFKVTKRISGFFKDIMKFRDQRVSLTANTLNGIKSIKYLRWEEIFLKKIMSIREKEFAKISQMKYLDAFVVFFWAITSIILIVSTFFVFESLGYDIVKDNVFTVKFYGSQPS